MKKNIKVLALAVVAMMVAVACNNAPEATEDTTAIDTTPVEAVVEDTTPVMDTVPAVETPAPAKKATKKTTTKKVDNNTSAADQSLDKAKSGTGSISVNKNTKSSNGTSAADQNLNNTNKGAGSISLKKN